MTDEELKAHFWKLCNEALDPIVDLARTHTSPSIERAVLLRMGIDSLSAHGVVERIYQAGTARQRRRALSFSIWPRRAAPT